MLKSRPLWIGVLTLTVCALVASRFLGQPSDSERTERETGPLLSAYARDLAVWSMNDQGELDYRAQAPTARYFDDAGLWQFDQPRWQVSMKSAAPWVGKADQGRTWNDQEQARLQGNVVLSQARPDGRITLNTEAINLTLQTRYAQTDQPVTLTGPSYDIAAIGAQAWLDEQRIELNSEVTGDYDPAQTAP